MSFSENHYTKTIQARACRLILQVGNLVAFWQTHFSQFGKTESKILEMQSLKLCTIPHYYRLKHFKTIGELRIKCRKITKNLGLAPCMDWRPPTRRKYYVAKVSPGDSLGARNMFLCPHCLWEQKVQMHSITVGMVQVSPPLLSISTAQCAFIEWQGSIHRSPPPLNFWGKKSKATTKVTLYELPIIEIMKFYPLYKKKTFLRITSHIFFLSSRGSYIL